MSSVCLFSSYSTSANIDAYIKVYLQELDYYFDKIIFMTNERELSAGATDWLGSHEIKLMQVENEGFDFGMWYKAMLKYDLTTYERIALVNDSCVLFNKLDKQFQWINAQDLDYGGLVSTNLLGYHVQSFFIVMNQKAYSLVQTCMKENGIVNDYRRVIKVYEVGLCKMLLSQGCRIGAMYDDVTHNLTSNPTFPVSPQLIEAGMPMIKKKILFRRYRIGEWWGLMTMNVDTDERKYISLIKNVNPGTLLVNFDALLKEQGVKNNRFCKWLYRLAMNIVYYLKQFKILRAIYRMLIHWKHILEGRTKPDTE